MPGFMFTLSQSVFPTPPPPVRGGILADDMGLGKSVQLLARVGRGPVRAPLWLGGGGSGGVLCGGREEGTQGRGREGWRER